jgi:hypothetical protein
VEGYYQKASAFQLPGMVMIYKAKQSRKIGTATQTLNNNSFYKAEPS